MRKKVYAYELMTLRTCRDIDKPFIIVIPRIFISSFRSIPGLADGSWKERLRLLSVIKKNNFKCLQSDCWHETMLQHYCILVSAKIDWRQCCFR